MYLHRRWQILLGLKELVMFALVALVSLSLLAAPHDAAAVERAACRANGTDVCAWPSLLEVASSRAAAII